LARSELARHAGVILFDLGRLHGRHEMNSGTQRQFLDIIWPRHAPSPPATRKAHMSVSVRRMNLGSLVAARGRTVQSAMGGRQLSRPAPAPEQPDRPKPRAAESGAPPPHPS
jgi:hypothetical protein